MIVVEIQIAGAPEIEDNLPGIALEVLGAVIVEEEIVVARFHRCRQIPSQQQPKKPRRLRPIRVSVDQVGVRAELQLKHLLLAKLAVAAEVVEEERRGGGLLVSKRL